MNFILYGSALSPFSLKVRFACERAGLEHRRFPEHAGTRENLIVQARRFLLVRGLSRPTHPAVGPLDELPLVPFLFGPDGTSYWDSSAIVRWLDAQPPREPAAPLVPREPRARFAAHLLDEAFDEVGLYALHHQRWVVSARSTRAAEVAGEEFRSLIPWPLWRFSQETFAARQVRRLPYLFSVAPFGFHVPGVAPHRQPRPRAGFPATHALLARLHEGFVAGLEGALAAAPFLLGSSFSIADAAAGGMIASHLLIDPDTAESLAERAPRAVAWARGLLAGRGDTPSGAVANPFVVSPAIEPLLAFAASALVPLLLANGRAHARLGGGPASRYNEAAFDRGEGLYDGELLGHPFRSVVKTFQVRVLGELRAAFHALDAADRSYFLGVAPALGGLLEEL